MKTLGTVVGTSQYSHIIPMLAQRSATHVTLSSDTHRVTKVRLHSPSRPPSTLLSKRWLMAFACAYRAGGAMPMAGGPRDCLVKPVPESVPPMNPQKSTFGKQASSLMRTGTAASFGTLTRDERRFQ